MTLRRWSGPGSGFGRSPAIRGTSRSPRPRTSLAPERSPWSSPVDEIRVGQGFDVHRFAPGRPLWLGGARFEGEGLAGHSGGDAVCHALADALLGAAALGDIGGLFPDTDPRFEGIGGLDLLTRVVGEVRSAGL